MRLMKTRIWIYFDKWSNETPPHLDQILQQLKLLLKAAGVLKLTHKATSAFLKNKD